MHMVNIFVHLPREDEDIAKWQAQGVQTFILGDNKRKNILAKSKCISSDV